MTQPTTATQSNAAIPSLYIALDLGRSSCQVSLTDGGQKTRDVAVDRSDIRAGKAALLTEIAKARAAFSLPPEAPLHAVYEAGRDGFWLARWLQSQGVQCLVIDPSSILVDRRAKHRKTDAIDGEDLADLRTGDDRPLGASLRHQIELLCVQIERLDTDIAACELERDQRIAKPKAELDKRAHPLGQRQHRPRAGHQQGRLGPAAAVGRAVSDRATIARISA